MKKTVFIALSILFATHVQAQFFSKKIKGNGHLTQIIRQVKEYDKISVAGSFDIELYKGNEGKIEVEIDDNLVEYLEIETNKDKLKIKWKENTQVNSYNEVKIKIPVEDVSDISLAGSVSLNNKEMLKFNDLTVKLAGSGNMNLHLTTNNVTINLAGSGTAYLRGKSEVASYSLAGSGEIEAFGFTTNYLDAKVAGSGNMNVFVTNQLKASVAGSGDISYKGHPKQDVIKVAGSGSIKMIP